MPGPLLATKTHVPRTRPTMVSRARLLSQLDAGLAYPLTLIAAPAGFGKTMLLCDWLQANGGRASWVSLDEGDDDPARFWAYVIASLENICPGIGDHTSALLQEARPDALEALLAALINALDALPGDSVLVLDDYHVIENDQIHRGLAFLINHLPAQMHIFLTTRADPPLPLARWRARGQLNEIRTTGLRFTGEEAVEFLTVSMGLEITQNAASILELQTEGWIAGLQLAALALRAQDAVHVADFVAASATSSRFLLDYLADEVLQRETETVQSFLLQTSILEHLTASLCDQVTGRSDGQAMLELLDRANLFITSTDSERRWYRYHTLFADLLRKLLGEAYPGLTPELHRRASQWYEEHEYPAEAICHALNAHDHERAAALIERAARATLRRGEISTLAGWLAALPDGVVLAHPALCVFKARTLIADGNLEGARPLLQTAESQISADLPPMEAAALKGQVATMRAMLAAQAADVPGMLAYAGEALRHLPQDRSFLRELSSWLQGLAYELSDHGAQGNTSLNDALSRSQGRGSALLVFLSTYAFGLLEMTQGRLSLARELYDRALHYIAQRDPVPHSAGLVYVGLGELCRARGDLAAAEFYLTDGLELLKRRADHNAAVQGLISLAWLHQAYGDDQGACAAIQEAEILDHAGKISARTTVQLRAQRARLALRQGDLASAQRWANETNLREQPRGDDLASQYLYQVVHSTWVRLLIAEGRPRQALEVLDLLRGHAQQAGWGRVTISLGALGALAWQVQGDVDQALESLRDALALAEPEGYIRLFADEGPAMARLLAEGTRRGVWGAAGLAPYAERVLAGCAPQTAPRALHSAPSGVPVPLSRDSAHESAGIGLAEPLSEREAEVLRLLDQGLSYRQIGQRLYLSLGTVKTHVHHIYSKLAAPDRQHALQRARDLHFL